jgi:hypothetical protein
MSIYKHTITVTVLVEDEDDLSYLDLTDIADRMMNDNLIGRWETTACVVVPEEDVEKELIALGNDGTFFGEEENTDDETREKES